MENEKNESVHWQDKWVSTTVYISKQQHYLLMKLKHETDIAMATHFRRAVDMLLSAPDVKKHLDKYFSVDQSICFNQNKKTNGEK